jgi:hypothetical protein
MSNYEKHDVLRYQFNVFLYHYLMIIDVDGILHVLEYNTTGIHKTELYTYMNKCKYKCETIKKFNKNNLSENKIDNNIKEKCDTWKQINYNTALGHNCEGFLNEIFEINDTTTQLSTAIVSLILSTSLSKKIPGGMLGILGCSVVLFGILNAIKPVK